MRNGFILVIFLAFFGAINPVHSEVAFSWWGMIISNPEDGIVAWGDPIQMTIDDDFSVDGLETNEFLANDGEPTYYWYLNDSETYCKSGQTVTFTTGDSDADISAGNFIVSVKGIRTYTVGWTGGGDGEGCPCGCEMVLCDCPWHDQKGGAKGKSNCKKETEETKPSGNSKDVKGSSKNSRNHIYVEDNLLNHDIK